MSKKEFVKVAPPNKETLAKLLKDAKGNARTMKQFAAECGASQAAFSRIVHGSYKGSLADDMIKTIAEHADPESEVNLDLLMGANGMARVLDTSTVYRDSRVEIEKSFVHAILSGFERSGTLVSYENTRKFKCGTTFKFQPDLLVKVKSEGMDSRLWAFELILPQIDISVGEGYGNISKSETSTRIYGRQFIEKMGRVLPLFYNENPIDKFSFVVTDKRVFEYLVSEYAENYPVPFELSFILYDAEKEVMEEEATLKQVK